MVLEVSIDPAAHYLRAKPRAPPATSGRKTPSIKVWFRAAFQPVHTGTDSLKARNGVAPTTPKLAGKIPLGHPLAERDL